MRPIPNGVNFTSARYEHNSRCEHKCWLAVLHQLHVLLFLCECDIAKIQNDESPLSKVCDYGPAIFASLLMFVV